PKRGRAARRAHDAGALPRRGGPPAAPFSGLAAGHERHYYGLVVRPNVFLNLLPDHVIIHTLFPLGPERSHVTCDWLFAPDAIARPGFDPTDTVELFDRVNRQDWQVCEGVQARAPARALRAGGGHVPVERHIRGFNDFVLAELGLTGDGAFAAKSAEPGAPAPAAPSSHPEV